jgi:hypothetical protein
LKSPFLIAAEYGYIEIGCMLLKKTDTDTVFYTLMKYRSAVRKILNSVDIIQISRGSIYANYLSSTDMKFFFHKNPIKGCNDSDEIVKRYKLKKSMLSINPDKTCEYIEYSIPIYQACYPSTIMYCLGASMKSNKADKKLVALTGN